MNKKICIVAPVHVGDDVRIYKKQALALSALGYEIIIFSRAPVGDMKNVNHVTLASYKSRFKRFTSLFGVFLKVISIKADLYLIHNPDTLPIGMLLKLFRRKVIYDTHEDFSLRIMSREWIPYFLRKIVSILVSFSESILCRFIFDASIATQERVCLRLGPKSLLLGNPPIKLDLNSIDSISDPSVIDFRLIYLGSITRTRGIDEIIKSLSILNLSFRVRLWLLGAGSEDTINELKSLNGWEYVDFVGVLPQNDAFSYLKSSNIGMITILDVGDHKYTDPNKIYEYMSLGIPFIASDFEAWRNKLKDVDAGWFCNPNADDIARCVAFAYSCDEERSEKGLQGLQYVSNSYNWEFESKRFTDLVKRVI